MQVNTINGSILMMSTWQQVEEKRVNFTVIVFRVELTMTNLAQNLVSGNLESCGGGGNGMESGWAGNYQV